MEKIEDIIIKTLIYKGREDLASLLSNSRYELNESSSYGSRLYSVLTSVIIYLGIEKLSKANNLVDTDIKTIIESFRIVYPLKDNSYEISSIEFLQDPEAPIPGISDMRIPNEIAYEHWKQGFFKLFISHSVQNKKIAKDFKDEMYNYGISAFVAHEDINPNKEWLNVIETSLISCDGILAILNDDFKKSFWCDQEIGFAYGQNKIIVPVNFGLNPYGFINKFQALMSNKKSILDITHDVLKILISNPKSSISASRGLVNSFCNSRSYKDANEKSVLLQNLVELDEKMIEDIVEAVKNNNQISKSSGIGNLMNVIEKKSYVTRKN
ncbi:MAG: toll/interleukin-1 receptor domain-containing protein [Bacteroidota bacterium]|nr:toll/interleukin-1 receptor domain-containing protein [Bacteroidota bacterium]